jgi:hypothetical protein
MSNSIIVIINQWSAASFVWHALMIVVLLGLLLLAVRWPAVWMMAALSKSIVVAQMGLKMHVQSFMQLLGGRPVLSAICALLPIYSLPRPDRVCGQVATVMSVLLRGVSGLVRAGQGWRLEFFKRKINCVSKGARILIIMWMRIQHLTQHSRLAKPRPKCRSGTSAMLIRPLPAIASDITIIGGFHELI